MSSPLGEDPAVEGEAVPICATAGPRAACDALATAQAQAPALEVRFCSASQRNLPPHSPDPFCNRQHVSPAVALVISSLPFPESRKEDTPEHGRGFQNFDLG